MFIFAIVLGVMAVLAVGVAVLSPAGKRGGTVALAALIGLGAAGAFIVASMSQVPTKNVGIVTEFSKPTGRTTGAGIQWHAPWQGVDDWDASRQTYSHLGDGCIWVNIAAQRRACIPVQIEYASRAERAPENWAAYKEVDGIDGGRFGTFVERRVNPQINAALTTVFASFDPLGPAKVAAGAADPAAPDLNATYREPLRAELDKVLGQDVEILSVAFEAPRYDEKTQGQIDAYGQKILEARNLAVDEANAKTRARITATDASVDQVARCLQIAEKAGKEPGLCMNPLGVLATQPGK